MIMFFLSRLLGERRWTQADLSRATGICASTIRDMYHEMAERVNLSHLDLICEALDCDLADLLSREPSEETHVKSKYGTEYCAK